MSKWPAVPLGECARIVGGSTPSTSVAAFWDGDIRWATPKDLSELDGPHLDETPRKITQEGLKSCAAEILPVNSVLFSSRAPIGHVAVNRVPTATNQGFKSFVPDAAKLDTKFLYYWLRVNRPYLERLGNGATFKEVSKSIVSRVEVPLPPLPEQRRIAAILDQAEALRAKRRQALAQLDELHRAIFLSLFMSGEARNWPEVTVSALSSNLRTGPFGSQLLHSEFVDSGVAVLGIDNAVQNQFVWSRLRFITEQKFRQLRRYQVLPGDVLVTIMGTCGRCAVVPDDIPVAINTKHLCCITLDQTQCLPLYLQACFLLHPRVLERLGVRERGAVMPGLNMQIIKELPIPLPPLCVQQEFAAHVAAVERLKETQRGSLTKLDALFASLQHRAFRGEL